MTNIAIGQNTNKHPERDNPYVEEDLLNLKRVLNND